MENSPPQTRFMNRTQAVFFKGLFTLLPLLLTAFLLVWAVSGLEKTFGNAILALLPSGLYVPGLGILLALVLTLFTGLLVENYLAARIWNQIDHSLRRAPGIRAIYSPLRDLTDLFGKARNSAQSQKVVFVKLKDQTEMVGLVMRDQFEDLGELGFSTKTVAVFLPFSYGFGGVTVLVNADQLREAGLSAERALQLAITGWVKTSGNTK